DMEGKGMYFRAEEQDQLGHWRTAAYFASELLERFVFCRLRLETIRIDRPTNDKRTKRHSKGNCDCSPSVNPFVPALGHGAQEECGSGIKRQQIIGPLETRTREHEQADDQPGETKPCFAIIAPRPRADEPPTGHWQEQTPGEHIERQPRAVEPPGM